MSGLSNDDILRMAREVADKDKVDPVHNDMVTLTVDELGRLLAAEREACAKLCDALKNPIDDPLAPVGQYESGCYITAEFLADAIRARGQQENG